MRQAVRVGGNIAAAPSVIFACLSDFEQAKWFIDGLESLSPVGDQTNGLGASFDAVMKVGPKTFRATITIAALEVDRLVTWASTSDQGQTITFKLKPADAGTQTVMEISYERPSGLTGALVAPVVEETVRSRAHASMRRLRDHVTQS